LGTLAGVVAPVLSLTTGILVFVYTRNESAGTVM
jgi:hypothetical protein